MFTDESHHFTTFGSSHLTALAVFLILCWPLVALGRRQRATGDDLAFRRAFAVAIPLFTIPMQALQFTPSEWDIDTSLPLQICDFAWVVAVYALWTGHRWAASVNWFWGMTLTVQGMLTPDLASGWAEPRFWMFWGMHALIVWSAIYLVWGLRIVPTWRDYRLTVALTTLWAAAAMTFNAVVGTNYGYLNAKPHRGSVLDVLPAWPTYVVIEVVVVSAVWALMTWLWVRRPATSRVSSQRPPTAP